jgi:hypothetical protein
MPGPKPIKYLWLLNATKTNKSDACLLWPFGKDSAGYGRVAYKGKSLLAHRVAFYVEYGRWPMPCGRHSCDTPLCFNWRHVVEGSQAANIADATRKGRMVHGERQHSAKLTAELVKRIRSEYKFGVIGSPRLGKKYGVNRYAIELIIKRKTWKHV